MLTQTRFASSGVTGLSKLIVGLRLAADTVRHYLYLLTYEKEKRDALTLWVGKLAGILTGAKVVPLALSPRVG
jgi:hypothetical protein